MGRAIVVSWTIACAALLLETVPLTWATTSAPPYGKTTDSRAEPKREFSCAGQPLSLSRKQLESIAIAEFERRSGAPLSYKTEITLRRDGCDWVVFVRVVPAFPGGHFWVVVDGLTGMVKEYVPGA
jgi:hypothetical protein